MFAPINGVNLHFTDTAVDRPAIIFLHGFLMDASMFNSQQQILQDSYRVISIDSRGHGLTPGGTESFTYWDLADDVLGLMEHLGIAQATLAGMSQGGFTALRTALKSPDSVRALVLISTEAAALSSEKKRSYGELFASWGSTGASAEMCDELANLLIGHPGHSECWIEKWLQIPWSQLELATECLIERDDVTEHLSTIQQPALVLCGDDDREMSVEHETSFSNALQASKDLVVVSGARHAVNITHFEEVNEVLLGFLSDVYVS